jgi:hypothetical protein
MDKRKEENCTGGLNNWIGRCQNIRQEDGRIFERITPGFCTRRRQSNDQENVNDWSGGQWNIRQEDGRMRTEKRQNIGQEDSCILDWKTAQYFTGGQLSAGHKRNIGEVGRILYRWQKYDGEKDKILERTTIEHVTRGQQKVAQDVRIHVLERKITEWWTGRRQNIGQVHGRILDKDLKYWTGDSRISDLRTIGRRTGEH